MKNKTVIERLFALAILVLTAIILILEVFAPELTIRYGQQFMQQFGAESMPALFGILIAAFFLDGFSWFLIKSQNKKLKKIVVLSGLALLIIVAVGLPVLISWSLPAMRY